MTKPSFRILTKIEFHNHMKHQQQNSDQTKIHLGFNILQNISRKELTKLQLQILPELQLQNLDQTLCSKSEQKFNFMTKTSASKSATNCRQHVSKHQHQQQSQPQQVLCGIFTCQGFINQVYLTGFI